MSATLAAFLRVHVGGRVADGRAAVVCRQAGFVFFTTRNASRFVTGM